MWAECTNLGNDLSYWSKAWLLGKFSEHPYFYILESVTNENLDKMSLFEYSEEKARNLSEDIKSCPICYTEFKEKQLVMTIFCLHRFCPDCITPWFKTHATCPICKKD